MAATSKNITTETVEVEEKDTTKVPHQNAKVTSITKDDGEKVVFYGEDDDNDLTLVEKAKRIVKNKHVIAGVTSVALLTVGVLVARKRNSEDEKDDSETPAEA